MLVVPRLFLANIVRQVVAPGSPGAYALGHDPAGRFEVGYLGRSDSCLQSRLVTHNHLWHFDYFVFRYATSDNDASTWNVNSGMPSKVDCTTLFILQRHPHQDCSVVIVDSLRTSCVFLATITTDQLFPDG